MAGLARAGQCRVMVSASFVTGLALLLATPGPTNTLLALGGATGGLRRTPRLLAAELFAYLAAILLLGAVIEWLGTGMAQLRPKLQFLAAGYLLFAALRMWRFRPERAVACRVDARLVAVTTLLNPKTLIIAFVLMPQGWSADAGVAGVHLLVLALMVPLAGSAWLVGGHLAAALAGGRVQALVPRASAVLLAIFATVLAGKAFAG